MKPLYSLLVLLLGLGGFFAPQKAAAQETTSSQIRVLTVSPIVGESIDKQEKITYGLFPFYSFDDFREARFIQRLTPDSSITLQATMLDGSIKQRPFTINDFRAVRVSIEARQKMLSATPGFGTARIGMPDSLGQMYSVELRTGTSFVGRLVAQRAGEYEFQTTDLGRITVQRANIKTMQPLTSDQAGKGWEPVGNGTRLFFAPTARTLRQGEGYVQDINIFFVGANYGITNNIAIGGLVGLVPGAGLNILAVTPKVGVAVTEKFSVGAGVLFASVFGETGGIGYGLGTYGTADNNVTLGLGYLFADGEVESSPVVVLGGATRISRRVSLLNETYIVDGGFGGLAGLRIAAARLSGSLGILYGTDGEDGIVVPAYLEVTYRFGKVK
ncbi:hypothetical protein GCM10011375_07890 [Hymenobacter qilianensis]|uniref:Uncharacterized protein n=2 Tax=Hymenobacter qilianensis TaxID=1385715 RepID=A0ACB5PNA1_9BACT|nr:hypothetical protein [Hymenobacter qilianensis]QNP53582.1 hypothetical protein H9L05_08510 [Hymenobacter qilianensis]GGF54996.1 hypothetical protein GCM10011375_07890 [Hymenobacter qilianensis]